MMPVNIEALSKKIKKFGMDTMTEVQKMNEIRQLTSRVNEEKKKINAVYAEMGKKLYELYKEVPFEGFEAEFQSIEEKFTLIDLLQDQIRGVKGVVLCENCNTEVNAGERFCSNCGNRMPEVAVLENKDTAEETADMEEIVDEVVEEEDIVAAEEAVETEADEEVAEAEADEEAVEAEAEEEVVEAEADEEVAEAEAEEEAVEAEAEETAEKEV